MSAVEPAADVSAGFVAESARAVPQPAVAHPHDAGRDGGPPVAGAAAMNGSPPRRVVLAHEADFDGFRDAARRLAAAGVEPDAVQWSVAGRAADDLFGAAEERDDSGASPGAPAATAVPGRATATAPGADAGPAATAATSGVASNPVAAPVAAGGDASSASAASAAPRLTVPAAFVELCRDVVQHADPARFALLYRLLWRLSHEPALRHDPLDPDRLRAREMAQAVRREQHRMQAFVRFRAFVDDDGRPWQGAWYEPAHHVVDAVAPFFAARFANLRWVLLTPGRSVRWDGERLDFGPGASRDDAPAADAGEALWLTYYASIFNPARANARLLDQHLPARYRPNLPEAALIPALQAQAAARTGAMLAREPRPTERRLPAAAMRPRQRIEILAEAPARLGVASAVSPSGAPGGHENGPAAGRAADPAADWDALRTAAAGCRDCPLYAAATQTVFGEGPLGAALMLVGEQPGDQEDRQGHPFVGPSGALLDRAVAALGWDRSVAYVTNAVKHFKYEPRGQRRIHKTPAQREADACRHWLESEIAVVRPRAAIALGATAARQLLGRPVGVMRERGRWLLRDDGLPVLVTLHPSALLRGEPSERESAWAAWLQDLRAADAVARGGAAPVAAEHAGVEDGDRAERR